MSVSLHVKRLGEGPAVVLLHGLFGAGNNLGVLAQALRDNYRVFSLDLPNHGRSAWLRNPDLATMAASLQQWMDAEGLSRAHFVGHSLGGKVAMQFALQHPQRAASLVIADIAPVTYSPHHDTVFAALAEVDAAHCTSRKQASRVMAEYLKDEALIQFLLMSLQRDSTGIFRWRFDFEGLRLCYASMLAAPSAGLPYSGPTLFIKGGTSDYILEKHWPMVQRLFPQATIKVLPGCSHWLHAEKPQLFNGIVQRFLVTVKPSMLSSPT